MSGRQKRLSGEAAIKQALTGIDAPLVNVVLHNNMVINGTVQTLGEHHMIVINMRRKKVSIAYADIHELYFDVYAPC